MGGGSTGNAEGRCQVYGPLQPVPPPHMRLCPSRKAHTLDSETSWGGGHLGFLLACFPAAAPPFPAEVPIFSLQGLN